MKSSGQRTTEISQYVTNKMMVFFFISYHHLIYLSLLVVVGHSFIIYPGIIRCRHLNGNIMVPSIVSSSSSTSRSSSSRSNRSHTAFLLLSRGSTFTTSLPTNSSGSSSSSISLDDPDKVQLAYRKWLQQYKKPYDKQRYVTFQQNFRLAQEYYSGSNECSSDDDDLELNEFADCTEEEYLSLISPESANTVVSIQGDEIIITPTETSTRKLNGIPSSTVEVSSQTAKTAYDSPPNYQYITIGRNIGSGSYGTVHLCTFTDNNATNSDGDSTTYSSSNNNNNHHNNNNRRIMIAKRAWTEEELARAVTTESSSSSNNAPGTYNFHVSTSTTDSDTSMSTQVFSPKNNKNNKNNYDTDDDPASVVYFHTDSATTTTRVNSANTMNTMIKERTQLCQRYLQAERTCYEQMMMRTTNGTTTTSTTRPVPEYIGTFLDDENSYEWIVISFIGCRYHDYIKKNHNSLDNSDNQLLLQQMQQQQPAFTLADAIYRGSTTATQIDKTAGDKDNNNIGDNLSNRHHHLRLIQRELGILTVESTEISSFEYTLDTLFTSLFSAIAFIHQCNIVHCDIKPANILLDPSTSSLLILDFGSSISLNDTNGSGMNQNHSKGRSQEELNNIIMAISPMYAAPEGIFVGSAENKSPYAFDVYSGGLIFCQFLFNLFDDLTSTDVTRITPTSFYQQLREANYDLDLWLSTRSFSKLISEEEQNHLSSDLLAGLDYLSRRPGLWNILKNTVKSNPDQRYTANEVLQKFNDIQKRRSTVMDYNEQKMMQDTDGAYFLSVMKNLNLYESSIDNDEDIGVGPVSLISSRSLHFVATFDTAQSLGLTLTSSGGDVFVHGIINGGQAESMDCGIEVGDRLVGVGETPVYGGSFDNVISMLSNYPKTEKAITLHFDRTSLSKLKANLSFLLKEKPNMVKVVDHGAWSSLGERYSQEDSLLLQELHDEAGNIILLAGVFDGHGGKLASDTASRLLPDFFSTKVSEAMAKGNRKYELPQILGDVMESSWEMTCDTYRNGFDDEVRRSTGSIDDLVPGTTAVAATLSMNYNDDNDDDCILHIMNCGDSRALLVGRPRETGGIRNSFVHISTKDHSPSSEMEAARLKKGVEAGLDYSLPENSPSSSSECLLTIGGFQYEVSRSLEGLFATSKGIVSTPDMLQIPMRQVLKERENVSLILSSDGLFEWIGNEELSKALVQLREAGYSSKDAAKSIVSQALQKGASDNISVVVIYFS